MTRHATSWYASHRRTPASGVPISYQDSDLVKDFYLEEILGPFNHRLGN